MFPHQGNPTIAGIYDLLEIIIERLNRIEYNQDKERISRALGSACNEHHYLSDTLARARPEPYSYNNHQHTSLQNQTMLSPQPSSYVIPSNRSGTSKTAEQSPNEDNVISNSGGDIEEDTYEQVQKQQSNLEESIQANPTLTLEHRRKRKLSSPQQLEQKNAKKNKQDKEYAPSQEVLASEEILSTEEGSDEDQQFTREVENSQKKHKQVRFKMKPQRVNENASSQEETGIKKERNNRPQTEKDSALEDDVEIIEHVHDNVIQTGKNNLPKVGISTTSRQKKTKVVIKNMKAREPQILTRRRRCVLEKREQQTINKNPVFNQSAFEGSTETQQVWNLIKTQLDQFNSKSNDKRKKYADTKGRANMVYKCLERVCRQILKNRQNALQNENDKWDNLSAEIQQEILNEVEYEIHRKYENTGIDFDQCNNHWPTRVMMKHIFPTFKNSKLRRKTKDQSSLSVVISPPVIEPLKHLCRKPVVETYLEDDDDDDDDDVISD